MDSKNSKLDKIINDLCEGKDEDYKIFIRKMIYACILYTSDAADE